MSDFEPTLQEEPDRGFEEPAAAPSVDAGVAESTGPEDPGDRDYRSTDATAPPESHSTMNATTNKLEAESVVYANIVYMDRGDGDSRIERLSQEDFTIRLSPQQLEAHLRWSVRDSVQIGRVATALQESRLALIVGERNLGKETFAFQVAQHLLATQQRPRQVLMSRALQQNLRVSLTQLPAVRSSWARGNLLILSGAFDLENRDLLAFFADLNDGRFGALRDHLEKLDSFLVLTSELTERTPPGQHRLRSLGILHELLLPTAELRVEALYRHAERRFGPRERAIEGKGRAIYELLDSQYAALAEALRTLPRIVQFVEEHLAGVAATTLSIEEAVGRLDDLSQWLLDHLASDVEAWSFTVALALASAAPRSKGVPWLQFYPFWREVARSLDRQLRRNRTALTPRSLAADEDLLAKARAEVVDGGFLEGATIRFTDSSYPRRLWQVLLGPGRGLVALLVPLLSRLRNDGDFYLREAAGRALGRIGELDPSALVMPAVRSSARSADPKQHAALGKLFQGILGSGDRRYIRAALGWLSRAAAEDPEDRGPWMRAVCLREIGVFDLELAVFELRTMVVEADLSRAVVHLAAVDRRLEARDREVRRVTGTTAKVSRALTEIHTWEMRRAARAVLTDRERVLKAVEFALVGLCFALDPVRVLRELARWRFDPEHDLGAVISLVFLDGDGIADKLHRNRVALWSDSASEGGVPLQCSRLLAAAALDEEARRELGEFLEIVFGSLTLLPATLRRLLRHNFEVLLLRWSVEAEKSDENILRSAVEGLLRSLLQSPNPKLREEVYALLQRDRAFSAEGSELRPLALRVLERP